MMKEPFRSGNTAKDDTKAAESPRLLGMTEARELAEQFASSPSVRFESRKTIFLVDLYGIYLQVTAWMKKNDVPITSGELPAHIATFLLLDAEKKTRERERREFSFEGMDFWDLVGGFTLKSLFPIAEKIAGVEGVIRIETVWELFYAPSPLKDIEWRMKKEISDKAVRRRALSDLSRGFVNTQYGPPRDYRFYDDFIGEIDGLLGASRSESGFYNFRVERDRVRYLDEKEVDIRIAIRAMDIMAGGEADAICIVSSDQDYMPLHQRCRDAGLRTYHADVAKFDDHANVGRKIRELGDDAILVNMWAGIPYSLIQAYGSRGELQLTREQYSAVHRLLDDFGFDANLSPVP